MYGLGEDDRARAPYDRRVPSIRSARPTDAATIEAIENDADRLSGLGRRLVTASADRARLLGYERITLRTYADVPWNAPFYRSVGFVEEEPVTAFHRSLVETEHRLGLDGYGRRVQMAADLT